MSIMTVTPLVAAILVILYILYISIRMDIANSTQDVLAKKEVIYAIRNFSWGYGALLLGLVALAISTSPDYFPLILSLAAFVCVFFQRKKGLNKWAYIAIFLAIIAIIFNILSNSNIYF